MNRFCALNRHVAVCTAAVLWVGDVHAALVPVVGTFNNGGSRSSSPAYQLASAVGDSIAGSVSADAGRRLSGGIAPLMAGWSVPTMLNLLSVFSRKFHGTAGEFDLPVAINVPLTGAVSVEPRRDSGSGHALHFVFDRTVTHPGTARAVDAEGRVLGNAMVSMKGMQAIVTLMGIADARRVRVELSGVNTHGAFSASLGFLVGDINDSRVVTAADIAAIKARAGRAVSLADAMADLNVDGRITGADISAVKSRVAQSLP